MISESLQCLKLIIVVEMQIGLEKEKYFRKFLEFNQY